MRSSSIFTHQKWKGGKPFTFHLGWGLTSEVQWLFRQLEGNFSILFHREQRGEVGAGAFCAPAKWGKPPTYILLVLNKTLDGQLMFLRYLKGICLGFKGSGNRGWHKSNSSKGQAGTETHHPKVMAAPGGNAQTWLSFLFEEQCGFFSSFLNTRIDRP